MTIRLASYYGKRSGHMLKRKERAMSNWDHLCKALSEKSFCFFVGVAFILYALIFKQEGWEKGVCQAFYKDLVVTAIRFAPVCAMIIVIMAAITHLDKAEINAGVSEKIIAGKYGEFTAVIVSAMMPGGAGGGQLKTAWESGENRANVLVCLHAMMALSLNGFMFRSAALEWKLSLIWAGMASAMLVQVYLIGKILKPWL